MCTFSTSQLPKVVRTWCVECIFTWKRASRHNGVQLFISHLTTWLHTRRFSEPTFRPSGATNHWKNAVFRGFPTFSCTCIFFLLTLSLSLTLPTSAFPSVHIVGSLTSKLPSVNYTYVVSVKIIYSYVRWCQLSSIWDANSPNYLRDGGEPLRTPQWVLFPHQLHVQPQTRHVIL